MVSDSLTEPVVGAALPKRSCLFCNFSSISDFFKSVEVAAPKRSARFLRTSIGADAVIVILLDFVESAVVAVVTPKRAARASNLSDEEDTVPVAFPNFLARNSRRSCTDSSEIFIIFFSGSDVEEVSFDASSVDSSAFLAGSVEITGTVTETFRLSETRFVAVVISGESDLVDCAGDFKISSASVVESRRDFSSSNSSSY